MLDSMKTKAPDLAESLRSLAGIGEVQRRKKKAPKGLLERFDQQENLQATLQKRICVNDTVAFCGGIWPVRGVNYITDDLLWLPRDLVQKVKSAVLEGRALPRLRK